MSRSQWSESEFERVFRRHFDGVFRLLFRIVGSRAEAEDLAQEAFLRCYRDADPGLGDSLRPWLYRVAMNLAFNSRRDRRRREARHERSGRLDEADRVGRARDPIDSIVRNEEREAVRRTLARLAPRQAKLLLLRHAGLSYREVAEAYLQTCAECRVTVTLDRLDPGPGEAADAGAAFARFSGEAARNRRPAAERGWLDRIRPIRVDRIPVWRPAAVVLAAAAALVLVISYAPARQVLADFLSIFRVREFSAITIDRAQLDKLQTLKESLRTGGFVTPTTEREPGQPRTVASASEAGSLAGFDVQSPSRLPPGAQSKTIQVIAPGPVVRVEFDPAKIEPLIAAAGITGIRLPPMQAGTVRGEVASIVTEEYALPWSGDPTRAPGLRIVQATSPSVTLPPGVDPKALGEAYLEILGLPEKDARDLAGRIDWTGTFLIPIPAGFGTYREVEVHGAPGLYMEQAWSEDAHGRSSVVLWQRGDVVRAVIGERVAASEMLQIAESMR